MPVQKNHPEVEVKLQNWIAPIVSELDEVPDSGGPGSPEIIEDYQAFADRFSVRVVWQLWDQVSPADRVPVILEAYNRSRRNADLPKITHARGLTPKEMEMEALAEQLGGLEWSVGRTRDAFSQKR